MFDGRWRDTVDRATGPVGHRLQQIGVTADVLTATGLISATATAVAVATGHLHLAILLLILTGLHDLLDGPVAKASGTASVRGAFFDSVTDRVADALLSGWRGLVPDVDPSRSSRVASVWGARRHVVGVLPAGQGRIAGNLGQGRNHGAGRADDPARHRIPVRLVLGSCPVGDAGPHRAHRRRSLCQGLATGRSAGTGRHDAPAAPGGLDDAAAPVVARSARPHGGGPADRVSWPAGLDVPGAPARPARVSATGLRPAVTADSFPAPVRS